MFTWTARAAGVTTRATHVITEGGRRLPGPDPTDRLGGPARAPGRAAARAPDARALIAYEAQTFARLAASA